MAFWNRRRSAPETEGAEARASVENPKTPLSNPAGWLVSLFRGGPTDAGVSIDADNALEVPAVWAGVDMIGGTLGSLPLQVFQGDGDDRKLMRKAPLYRLLHDAPNPTLTSFRWRRLIVLNCLSRGRQVTRIAYKRGGAVSALYPLWPTPTVERVAGALRYKVQLQNGGTEMLAPEEVLDFVYMDADDGVNALSPILKCRNAIGLAKALEAYGSRFFANDARPGIIAEIPGRVSEPAAERLKKSIEEGHQGLGNKHRVMVLEEGAKVHMVGVEPEHAQFLETRRLQIEEVARLLRIPPVFLQDLTRGTYSNTEQQDLHYAKHTMGPWVEMIEQELNLKLAPQPGRFIEFNMDGLQRGDFRSRMEGFAKAIQSAIMTPNEARERMNLPAKPGGDDLVIQQNMVPTEDLPDVAGGVAGQGAGGEGPGDGQQQESGNDS